MKDKEKQIKSYCEKCIHDKVCYDCLMTDKCWGKDNNCKHYQPKLKDSVVLSKEEYAKKKKHLQNVLELSSFQLENVVKENEKLKEQLKDKKLLTEENYNKLCHLAYFGYDDAYEKGSKETAERFESELKAFIKVWKMAEDDAMSILFYRALFEKIGEIAKQFGVEIKE